MQRAWLGIALTVVVGGSSSMGRAQEASAWTEPALRAHARTEQLHLRFVRLRHDRLRSASQRACLDDVATRAGALTRTLEDRASLGWIPDGSVADAERQLDELERIAVEICTRTAVTDGDVEVDMWRHPFARRMPRDRMQLRLGARGEMVPRVRRGGYALVFSYAVRGALGGFVTDWLRVEATAALSWLPDYGPFGSVGARALITAPWSLFRIGAGLEAALIIASDRLGNTGFGWIGVQVGIPVELAFELNESVALTVIGGPLYTQAGQVRLDPRSIGGSVGVTVDVVL